MGDSDFELRNPRSERHIRRLAIEANKIVVVDLGGVSNVFETEVDDRRVLTSSNGFVLKESTNDGRSVNPS